MPKVYVTKNSWNKSCGIKNYIKMILPVNILWPHKEAKHYFKFDVKFQCLNIKINKLFSIFGNRGNIIKSGKIFDTTPEIHCLFNILK